MNRRAFVAGSIVLLAAPVAEAQHSSKPVRLARVGILNYAAAEDTVVNEFRDGLRDLGYVEGQNLTITYRWADGRSDRLPELAAELVMSNVDVIIAIGPAVWAAKRATTSVPIVIAFSGDPVGNGVVSNLARPGGNITGFSYMSTDLAAKRLELLNRMFPGNTRIAILHSPDEPATALEMRETEATARTIGVRLQPLVVRHPDDLAQAFTTAVHERADAVLVFTHGFAALNRRRIIELAARERLPTMYGWRDFVHEGGLMSYGPNIRAIVRKAASYVDRIIKGEKPGDLPVEQPTTFELVINMKTARALGLTIPPSLLLRADQVIE
jgi:putative tryptophan/tyrosine transport system substrate-binding protein